MTFSTAVFPRLFAILFAILLVPASLLPAQDVGESTETADQVTSEPDETEQGDTEKGDTEKDGGPKEDANQGQSDLDEAVIKRIDADSEKELESVAALLESSLKKGLDEENAAFAKKMLGSVLLQRAQGLAAGMMQARGRMQLQLRDEALRSLEDAVENDPELVEAFLLIARLNLLPGGDRTAITEATTSAIDLLEDDPAEQSAAYVLRALTQEDDDKKLADLDEAARLDPENVEAMQARSFLRLQQNDVEGAIADMEVVLLKDPTNPNFAGPAIQKLIELDRVADAIDLTTKMLAAAPSEGMYRMRAILHRSEQKLEEAMSDLNKAYAMAPKDPVTLLQRAELALDREDIKSAKDDYRAARQIAPQIEAADQTIALRSRIALMENRLADAINDAVELVERNPEDMFRQLRLATLYSLDNRPRKAIEVYTNLLDKNAGNAAILRSRGDAQLSVGDHDKAIKDYEDALEGLGDLNPETAPAGVKAEAAGIYNNLSWVLATSPKEKVRDGKRALKFGEKAAELSEYKEAHILSTLAAAYAESGNFEKAIEWSTKAVELGDEQDHEQLEQLQQELDSYKKGEPWREQQETEENEVPILSPEDLIDT
ncbi:MAG: tetratricopeptide repeat protein [Planctomycetaceae bacterium]|nr:tetratricopeptide repeat protein [Planctomycetaceae bacterium]